MEEESKIIDISEEGKDNWKVEMKPSPVKSETRSLNFCLTQFSDITIIMGRKTNITNNKIQEEAKAQLNLSYDDIFYEFRNLAEDEDELINSKADSESQNSNQSSLRIEQKAVDMNCSPKETPFSLFEGQDSEEHRDEEEDKSNSILQLDDNNCNNDNELANKADLEVERNQNVSNGLPFSNSLQNEMEFVVNKVEFEDFGIGFL